jgi:putative tributyrin esterase
MPDHTKSRRLVHLLCLVLVAGHFTIAQSQAIRNTAVAAGEVVTLKLASRTMGRELPYQVVLPVGYKNDKEARYEVVYLLHGLTGHYNNWIDKTRITDYAAGHPFIIVMPEGGDGWYTDSFSVPNDKYETYIITEFIPEIDKKFRTVAEREGRYIAGLSMGGYGAIKFGLKYPATFSVVGSFSGALGAAGSEVYTGATGRSIPPVFGPEGSPTRRSNDIFEMVRATNSERVKQLPFIYQACGTEDTFYPSNQKFVSLLAQAKVPHEYREHPGGHTWAFWDNHLREFLNLLDARKKLQARM